MCREPELKQVLAYPYLNLMNVGQKLEKKNREKIDTHFASSCSPALVLLLLGKKKYMSTCEYQCVVELVCEALSYWCMRP
jgi:hypothetical protein